MTDLNELVADASDMTPQQREVRVYNNDDLPLTRRQQVASKLGDTRWSTALGSRMAQENQEVVDREVMQQADNSYDIPDWLREAERKSNEKLTGTSQQQEEGTGQPNTDQGEEESPEFDPEDPWGTGNDPRKGTGLAEAQEQAHKAEKRAKDLVEGHGAAPGNQGAAGQQAVRESIAAKVRWADAISNE